MIDNYGPIDQWIFAIYCIVAMALGPLFDRYIVRRK